MTTLLGSLGTKELERRLETLKRQQEEGEKELYATQKELDSRSLPLQLEAGVMRLSIGPWETGRSGGKAFQVAVSRKNGNQESCQIFLTKEQEQVLRAYIARLPDDEIRKNKFDDGYCTDEEVKERNES